MNNKEAIIEMLKLLARNYIFATNSFKRDITKLVTTNVEKFVEIFTRDIRRKNFDDYNKYELLNLSPKQKKKIDGKKLYRYEYRENSNLKCIYTIEDENNIKRVILLCAFNEDGDKKKGKNSYNDNINRAIGIYLNITEN